MASHKVTQVVQHLAAREWCGRGSAHGSNLFVPWNDIQEKRCSALYRYKWRLGDQVPDFGELSCPWPRLRRLDVGRSFVCAFLWPFSSAPTLALCPQTFTFTLSFYFHLTLSSSSILHQHKKGRMRDGETSSAWHQLLNCLLIHESPPWAKLNESKC